MQPFYLVIVMWFNANIILFWGIWNKWEIEKQGCFNLGNKTENSSRVKSNWGYFNKTIGAGGGGGLLHRNSECQQNWSLFKAMSIFWKVTPVNGAYFLTKSVLHLQSHKSQTNIFIIQKIFIKENALRMEKYKLLDWLTWFNHFRFS